jgi:hypothetical protein
MTGIIYFFAQTFIFSQIVDLPKVDAPDSTALTVNGEG